MPKKTAKKIEETKRPNAPIHEEEEKEIDPDLLLETAPDGAVEEDEEDVSSVNSLLSEFDEEDLNPFGDKWEE